MFKIIYILLISMFSSNVFSATQEDTLACPADYEKLFLSYSVMTPKSIGFGHVYYCVIKGVADTEAGIHSVVKTIKNENKIAGDVTPLYIKVLKE